MEQRQDIVLGATFVALGLAAAWGATAYSGASGVYPMVLGCLLALTGFVVAIKAMRTTAAGDRVLIDAPIKFYTTVLVCVGYVALVVPLGFFSSSFLLMFFLPFALGFRRHIYALSVAAVFTGTVYLVFVVLLERPLPREALFTLFSTGS